MISAAGSRESRFLRACRREAVDATPVWFMRQAGRYMSDYRALRQKYTLLQLCRAPDLATQVTLQPVQRIEVDAAILFSDLLLPLEPMASPSTSSPGKGRRSRSRFARPATSNASASSNRANRSTTCSTPSARSSRSCMAGSR
jgi:uroporphyrinogen-III decarboxylase